jgi:hypothetical protein
MIGETPNRTRTLLQKLYGKDVTKEPRSGVEFVLDEMTALGKVAIPWSGDKLLLELYEESTKDSTEGKNIYRASFAAIFTTKYFAWGTLAYSTLQSFDIFNKIF